MFWYLHPFKTCKLVPISLNHVRLGAKEVPCRVYPKKRLELEFEPHCQSEDPLACQVRSPRWVRARTGTRASAPDARAPLRARTGTHECPRHPCARGARACAPCTLALDSRAPRMQCVTQGHARVPPTLVPPCARVPRHTTQALPAVHMRCSLPPV